MINVFSPFFRVVAACRRCDGLVRISVAQSVRASDFHDQRSEYCEFDPRHGLLFSPALIDSLTTYLDSPPPSILQVPSSSPPVPAVAISLSWFLNLYAP